VKIYQVPQGDFFQGVFSGCRHFALGKSLLKPVVFILRALDNTSVVEWRLASGSGWAAYAE
jgi:hypothetical protein